MKYLTKLSRIILASIIVAISAIGISIPHKAYALQPPTSYGVTTAIGYENLAEQGDMLIFVRANVTYLPVGSFPTDFTATQAWNVRWLNASDNTEIAASNPFNNPYYENGYGAFAIGLYLSATDVITKGVVFGSTNYTISLERNPAAETSWNGTPPEPTRLTVSWSDPTADQQQALLVAIIVSANDFRSNWSLTFNLQTSNTLTSDGENYFTSVIPNLRQLCPKVFSSYIISPTYKAPKTFNLTYALTLRNQWANTWLDMSAPATDWGIDEIWIYVMMWTAVIFAACIGVIGVTGTTQGLYWVVLMGIAVGGLIGFYPWSALGVAGLITAVIVFNEIWYKRTLQ